MSRSNSRRIVTNIALSASTWFLPIILSFVATPVLLDSLGHQGYGLYALVLGFIGYSFTFGIGKAAAKFVAEYRATGDDELANESVSATFILSVAVGLLGALSIVAASGLLIDSVLQIPATLRDEGKWSLAVAAGIILLTMLSQVWSFTLQGLHRFDSYAAITGVGSVIQNVGTIILAALRYDVVSILIWNLASAVLLAALFFIAVYRIKPRIRLTFDIRPSVGRAVTGYSGAIILTQVFGNVLLLVERSWITRVFGVDMLTYYVVPMTLALFLHAFVGSIVIVLFPIVNERLSDRGRVLKIYRISTKFVLLIAIFALVTSIILGEDILSAWVGEEVATRSTGLLAIHMATFGMLASATVAWHIVESYGRARANVIFSITWLVVGTVLMIALGRTFGLEGVAMARFVGCTAVIPLAIFVEARVLGSFSTVYWALSGIRLFVAAVIAGIAQALTASWLHGLAAAAAGISLGGLAYLGVLLSIRYFETEELNWFRRSLPFFSH
jgi:O-antigen/teichoic acid export membrane protein